MSDYEPYGKEWEEEMIKFTKHELIEMIKDLLGKDKKIKILEEQNYLLKATLYYLGEIGNISEKSHENIKILTAGMNFVKS